MSSLKEELVALALDSGAIRARVTNKERLEGPPCADPAFVPHDDSDGLMHNDSHTSRVAVRAHVGGSHRRKPHTADIQRWFQRYFFASFH